MASVTCAKCGQVWLRAEDVGFCAKCGAALFNSKATVQPEADTLKETPKKKASIAWGPTILAFSVIFALIFGLALVSEDINSGLKMITGINLAGPFTANYCD
ncbi:MAG: hypothetical protein HOL91_02650 [Actinobacteria bacterium]|jgi:uncharacterized membrane protein YvbJ|nr:hypothetical protein [Actinomycetota bacterium]MDA9890897.1 hypothetical protein [Actinomycetota bacterium]MDB9920193.1 hypothetical protein [Actinomycetota bacterium]HBK39422.1 hypothetical protein [Actinomycetota bacterium]|tara:strand:+ start:172 stop:477 length:306 start_codon:yes stop_codon:yes gene_type:complete